MIVRPERAEHGDGGPALVWRFPEPVRALASGVLGGGIGLRSWVLNAEVDLSYDRPDPAAHLTELAADLGLDPAGGVGLLTAAPVFDVAGAVDGGAGGSVTVGVSTPTWAAAPDGAWSRWSPGTINLVCWVPVPLADAALVNAVATVTEAKTQALLDLDVPGTGTASDAVVICCPVADGSILVEAYGGPRSTWGARLARAVHAAVLEGTRRFLTSPSAGHPSRSSAAQPHGARPSRQRSEGVAPEAGSHGGDGHRLAASLGIDPAEVLDLSASLNPCAPDVAAMAAARLDALGRYPDDGPATAALAAALGAGPDRVVLTNGGSEAIALVAAERGAGWVEDPEFSLYRRHLRVVREGTGRWRSNPHNPSGLLAAPHEQAAVWDEAFWPLATGTWTRGDAEGGATVVGSLTKLFACPGLRVGYVITPDGATAERLRRRRPAWSVNGLACALVPELIDQADLPRWSRAVAHLRSDLATALRGAGYHPAPSDAPWLLVPDAGDLRERLARHAVLTRDCTSFGLAGTVRIAVPDESGLARLAAALG